MEIREFEKAFRGAMGDDFMRPALAAPGLSSQIDVALPPEFQAAVKSLAKRSGEESKEASILRAVAQAWM